MLFIVLVCTVNATSQTGTYRFGAGTIAGTNEAGIHFFGNKTNAVGNDSKFEFVTEMHLAACSHFKSAVYKTANEKSDERIDELDALALNKLLLNINFGVQYQVSNLWQLGLKTDLAGFTLSNSTTGNFSPSMASVSGGPTRTALTDVSSKAYATNVQLFSPRNRGNVYAAVYANQKLKTGKISLQYLLGISQTQVLTDNQIGYKGNRRFNANAPIAGICLYYHINNSEK